MIAFGVSDFTAAYESGCTEFIYDDNGNLIDVTSSPRVVSIEKSRPVALYLMPGIRFQENENRAFQISVAGVSVWQDGDFIAFP